MVSGDIVPVETEGPVVDSAQTDTAPMEVEAAADDESDKPKEKKRRKPRAPSVHPPYAEASSSWRVLRKEFNKINKEVAHLKVLKLDATEVINSTNENKKQTTEKEEEVQAAEAALDAKQDTIGNLIHDSVPISKDEWFPMDYNLP